MKNIIIIFLIFALAISLHHNDCLNSGIRQQHEIINGYRYLLIEKEKQNDTLRWFNQMKIKY